MILEVLAFPTMGDIYVRVRWYASLGEDDPAHGPVLHEMTFTDIVEMTEIQALMRGAEKTLRELMRDLDDVEGGAPF